MTETITVTRCDFCREVIPPGQEWKVDIAGNPNDACDTCKAILIDIVVDKNLRELAEIRGTLYPAPQFDIGKTVDIKRPERSLEPLSEPGIRPIEIDDDTPF